MEMHEENNAKIVCKMRLVFSIIQLFSFVILLQRESSGSKEKSAVGGGALMEKEGNLWQHLVLFSLHLPQLLHLSCGSSARLVH